MLKMLGALLLTGGGLAAGLSAARELSARLKGLRAWTDILGDMERELTYALPSIPQLLTALARRAEFPAADALTAAGEGMVFLGKRSMEEIWSAALIGHSPGLAEEDIRTLLRLGGVLGHWNGEEQRRAIAGVRETLEATADHVRERLNREGRVYGAVGLSTGAFLTILLL